MATDVKGISRTKRNTFPNVTGAAGAGRAWAETVHDGEEADEGTRDGVSHTCISQRCCLILFYSRLFAGRA